eukprot:3975440-Amphidinium_carterae.1
MLNTQSLRRSFRGWFIHSFRGWCENNNFSTLLNKFMDADGTMKPQYVTGDNGVEHDHKVAMLLHKWNKDAEANTIYNGQTITMRVGTPPDSSDVRVKSQ